MWRDFLPSTVVLACGIAIAIGGFFAARNHLLSLERRGFEVEAASYAGSLRDGVRQYVEAVNSIAAFVSASRGVDRWEFLRFAERTLPRYPGFAALEWVPRVQAQNRVKYERRAQVDGQRRQPEQRLPERRILGRQVRRGRPPLQGMGADLTLQHEPKPEAARRCAGWPRLPAWSNHRADG